MQQIVSTVLYLGKGWSIAENRIFNFSFVFFFHLFIVAVPILVAAGGGGLGVGHLLDDETQHGKTFDSGRVEVSGERHGDVNVTGGAGNIQIKF